MERIMDDVFSVSFLAMFVAPTKPFNQLSFVPTSHQHNRSVSGIEWRNWEHHFYLNDGVFTFGLGLPLENGKARCWKGLGRVTSIFSG